MSFMKQKIGLSSNIAPLFSMMRHNSFVLFQLKFYILSTRRSLSKYKFGEISPEQSKVRNFALWCVSLVKIIESFTSRSTEYLSFMTMKSDVKFKEKLTCGFKYDMRNLVSFHPTTQKPKNFTSLGYFCPEYFRFELKKYRGFIFHYTEQ